MASKHSAAGAALGYQYQADYCLLTLLRDAAPGLAVSLELHDDVAWDQDGTPLQKLQLKHSVKSTGGLGDMSDAIWRTIKAWLDDGVVDDPDGPDLYLVTTTTATPGTAAYALRDTNRQAAHAAGLLRAAAKNSTDKDTAAWRAEFLALQVTDQNALVGRIHVVDAQPTVVDLEEQVRLVAFMYLPGTDAARDDFMANLWGWWRGRVVEMLSRRYFPERELRGTVTVADLKHKLLELQVAYSAQGLPEYLEFDVDHTDAALAGLEGEVFVQQLRWITDAHRLIRTAVVDYYRAVSSETRWLERDFLRSDEVEKYERRLCEAWNLEFGLMEARLGATATDEELREAGLTLLTAVLARIHR